MPPLDRKNKELSDVNLFSFMLDATTFHRYIIHSATTNELNERPSRVSERLAKDSHLEKNYGGNAVKS